nr:unnamed protein product [Callosobruchus analis]
MESNNICRSCLRNTQNFRNIFSTKEILDQHVLLRDIYIYIYIYIITKDDGYPENICIKCFQLANFPIYSESFVKNRMQH